MPEIKMPLDIVNKYPELGNECHVGVAWFDDNKDFIYFLRYMAYKTRDYIEDSNDLKFLDHYDESPSNYSIYIKQDGQIAASMRICYYNKDTGNPYYIPSFQSHPDETRCFRNVTFYEGNRFVVYPGLERYKRAYPMILMRYAMAAIPVLGCEYALAAPRRQHIPFYSRYFKMELVANERSYPGIRFPTVLLAAHKSKYDIVCNNNPVLRVADDDLTSLFGGIKNVIGC